MGVRDTPYRSSAFADSLPGGPLGVRARALPAAEKLPGETGPAAAPLRGADDGKDPFQFLDDPSAPKSPLELLGRSIEGPFGLKRGRGRGIAREAARDVPGLDARRGRPAEGARGRGHPALNWLDAMRVRDSHPRRDAHRQAGRAGGRAVAGRGVRGLRRPRRGPRLEGPPRVLRDGAEPVRARAAHEGLPRAPPGAAVARRGGRALHAPRAYPDRRGQGLRAREHPRRRRQGCRGCRARRRGAANGYAPDYEAQPEERAGAQFSLAFHADDESGPDERFAERAAEAAAVAELVERFCRDSPKHLKTFLLEDLRHGADARSNPKPYIDALNVLMPALLARGPSPRNALATEDTPGMVFLEALRCAEGPTDLREASLTLLTTLWSAFPDEIEVKGEDCRQAVSVLKRGARDVERATQIHALACLFQLLHAFINAANAFSPVVYKTIVFMLIEHMRNDVVRDFITAELKVALDTHSNIPVGILVDPVVKQTSPGGQHPGLSAPTSRSSPPCPSTRAWKPGRRCTCWRSACARRSTTPAVRTRLGSARSRSRRRRGSPRGSRVRRRRRRRWSARRGRAGAHRRRERRPRRSLLRRVAAMRGGGAPRHRALHDRRRRRRRRAPARHRARRGDRLRGAQRHHAPGHRGGAARAFARGRDWELQPVARTSSRAPGGRRPLPVARRPARARPWRRTSARRPGQHNAVFARKKNVSDAPFASPPPRTRGSVLARCALDGSKPGGAPADASHRRPPGPRREPVCGGGRVAGVELRGRARRLRAAGGSRGFPRAPERAARAAQRGDAVLGRNSQAMGSDGSLEPFVIDPERARRPANPTPARARARAREARRRDSKIAARRAQKERERERARAGGGGRRGGAARVPAEDAREARAARREGGG